MTHPFRTAAALFMLPVIILFSSCSRSSKPVVPGAELLGSLGLTPLSGGREVPDIQFLNAEGTETLRLSDFRESVVLLNFWASWCPPCRAEMPGMERLAEALADLDFVMLPVNVEEDMDLVAAFVKEFELEFPVYLDPDGQAAREIAVPALPTTLLIDRDGQALAYVTGALEWDTAEMIAMFSGWAR
jgi:thiol-disulfide isomerase/thioredoxin